MNRGSKEERERESEREREREREERGYHMGDLHMKKHLHAAMAITCLN